MTVAHFLLAGLAVTGFPYSLAVTLQPRQQQQPPSRPFVPSPGNFPPTGDDTIAGGIFCISLPDLATYLARTGTNAGATGSETPKGGGAQTSGSGPYPADAFLDSAMPRHTIFAPKIPPAGNVSLPFIVWGNGGCALDPTSYRNLLIEIASWGYVISADGRKGLSGGQSMVRDMKASLDWGVDAKGAAKYGNVNTSAVAAMGHSCGGLEAVSTSYKDPRVKLLALFNIAIFQDERRYLLQEIKIPVAWFVGGKGDMGYPNAQKDYQLIPTGLPAYKASLDTGHGGTFAATNGGKQGKAAVSWLQWQFRGDQKSKATLLDAKAPGSLVSENWSVEYKNLS